MPPRGYFGFIYLGTQYMDRVHGRPAERRIFEAMLVYNIYQTLLNAWLGYPILQKWNMLVSKNSHSVRYQFVRHLWVTGIPKLVHVVSTQPQTGGDRDAVLGELHGEGPGRV